MSVSRCEVVGAGSSWCGDELPLYTLWCWARLGAACVACEALAWGCMGLLAWGCWAYCMPKPALGAASDCAALQGLPAARTSLLNHCMFKLLLLHSFRSR
jgi:hypothetical protein